MDKSKLQEREAITGHAVMSPSQLYRILLCPGSVQESTYAPIPTQSEYAARGTRLHDVVTKAVEQSSLLKNQEAWVRMRSGEDEDDAEQVVDCLQYRANLIRNASKGSKYFEERRVDLTSWGLPEIYGTCDFSLIDLPKRRIHVPDWKFGSGVKVYAEWNAQGLAYAAGALGYPSDIEEVWIHVVQPPIDHFDVFRITYHELADWVFGTLTKGIEAAKHPEAPLVPGKTQCQFCPAAMTCRARMDHSLEAAKEGFKIHSKLNQVSKDELLSVYDKLESAVKYRNDIAKFIELELNAGRGFPGKKLVAGRSTRKWDNEDAAQEFLESQPGFPKEKIWTKKLISCAQAEKVDKSLKKNDHFQELIDKPPGKPKVVDESDPRPALKPTGDAASAFADMKE